MKTQKLSEKKLKFFAHKKSQNKTDVLLIKDVKATFQRIFERIEKLDLKCPQEKIVGFGNCKKCNQIRNKIKKLISEEAGF